MHVLGLATARQRLLATALAAKAFPPAGAKCLILFGCTESSLGETKRSLPSDVETAVHEADVTD